MQNILESAELAMNADTCELPESVSKHTHVLFTKA